MNRKWTEQEIWSWFREHEWISGFNFVPSTPAGGVYALLQEYDHKNAFQEAAKEISLAASLGLNSVRLFLPFELWRQQHDSFMKNLEEFISLLDFYHMTIMPVLFNDCTVQNDFTKNQFRDHNRNLWRAFLGEPVIILLTKKHRQGSR